MPSCGMNVSFQIDKEINTTSPELSTALEVSLTKLIDSTSLKVAFGLILAASLIFINFYTFLIYHEKYGRDPMKRSLKDTVMTQMGYGALLNTLISMSVLSWRIFINPFHYELAALGSAFTNFSAVWVLVSFNEIAVIRMISMFR